VEKSRVHRGFLGTPFCDPSHNPRSVARPAVEHAFVVVLSAATDRSRTAFSDAYP
jgi:hypothetical protein